MGKDFVITEDHVELLKHMCVSWNDCEFGAPEIDPKRPYGNSDVISDIREILKDEGKECPHCGEHIAEDVKYTDDELRELHCEMQTVIQIGLQTGSFDLGEYVLSDGNWVTVE